MASTDYVIVCTRCGQVRNMEGVWEEVHVPEEIRVNYGFCPECEKKTEEELE